MQTKAPLGAGAAVFASAHPRPTFTFIDAHDEAQTFATAHVLCAYASDYGRPVLVEFDGAQADGSQSVTMRVVTVLARAREPHELPSVPRSALHEPDDDIPATQLDMDAIYLRAVRESRPYVLEFDCDGRAYKWNGRAKSAAAAELAARADLTDKCEGFRQFGARLVAVEILP